MEDESFPALHFPTSDAWIIEGGGERTLSSVGGPEAGRMASI